MPVPPLLQVACPGVAQQQPGGYLLVAPGQSIRPPASLWGIGPAEPVPYQGSKLGQPGQASAAALVLCGRIPCLVGSKAALGHLIAPPHPPVGFLPAARVSLFSGFRGRGRTVGEGRRPERCGLGEENSGVRAQSFLVAAGLGS